MSWTSDKAAKQTEQADEIRKISDMFRRPEPITKAEMDAYKETHADLYKKYGKGGK